MLIESSDGFSEWGTVGVNENIVEASLHALVDSLEYDFSHLRRYFDLRKIPLEESGMAPKILPLITRFEPSRSRLLTVIISLPSAP